MSPPPDNRPSLGDIRRPNEVWETICPRCHRADSLTLLDWNQRPFTSTRSQVTCEHCDVPVVVLTTHPLTA